MLLNGYSPMPYHYVTSKVVIYPRSSVPCHLQPAPSQTPHPIHLPLAHTIADNASRISASHSDLHFCNPLRDTDMWLVLAV